jgi:hypothetical protein
VFDDGVFDGGMFDDSVLFAQGGQSGHLDGPPPISLYIIHKEIF